MRIRKLQNNRTKFTRMCIGEAIIELLKKGDLAHLRILTVVKKAGVSRVTFYKYYPTLQAALEDYLQIIIAEYLEELEIQEGGYEFRSYTHILFALKFFDRYRDFFITMKNQGLYSILIDSVNAFVAKYILTEGPAGVYRQYSYAGSLLNCFLMWEVNGKKDQAEDVARTIYELYGETKKTDRHRNKTE